MELVHADSIWSIPLAETGSLDHEDHEKDRRSDEAFSKLQDTFPSMSVTLHWMKDVRRSSLESETTHPDYNNLCLKWPVNERLQLHSLARGMLMDFVRGASPSQILSSSKHSLRSVHILAMGLRALVRQAMGANLTAAEVAALGSVRSRHGDSGDDLVSVSVGKAREEDTPDPVVDLNGSSPSPIPSDSPGGFSSSLQRFSAPNDTRTPDSPSLFHRPKGTSTSTMPRVSNIQRLRSAKLEISWTNFLLQKRLNETVPSTSPLHASPTARSLFPELTAEQQAELDILDASASDIMNIPNPRRF